MTKATGPAYNVPFKRRARALTNYRKRLALLKSRLPRLVVRKTNRSVIVQISEFTPKFDRTIVSADSRDLRSFGWSPRANLPTAYLTALLCAKRALKAGAKKAVLDVGLSSPTKGSLTFAALKGALDGGLEVAHGEIDFDMERISGAHIAEYAKSLKGTDKYKKQFGAYVAAGVEPERLAEMFNAAKEKILVKS